VAKGERFGDMRAPYHCTAGEISDGTRDTQAAHLSA
jgi:hypothetical protein